jgi:hypothetical protein
MEHRTSDTLLQVLKYRITPGAIYPDFLKAHDIVHLHISTPHSKSLSNCHGDDRGISLRGYGNML